MAEKRDLSLSASLLDRVDERVRRTQFGSPAEYVEFVLEEVLYQVEAENADATDSVDETAVRERLESLGYIDG